ncbi:MAG TPA: HNH endonuclease, partial [Gemmataceae bacterium]|nr:HNH endonuclease [Gemmataceae bacterium]
MAAEARRRKLFDLFSKNLAAAKRQWPQLPAVSDHFLCPLCRQIFDRSALNPPERVSIEHTIPSALGGTYKTATLVCTACNNKAGSTLDCHITNRLQAEEFFQGISGRPRRSTIKMGEFKVRADWLLRHAERQETELRIDGKNSNPADVEGLKNEMKKALLNPGTTFNLGCEMRFSMWKTHVALLRMAYLLAFRAFGYAYALHRCVRPVLH